MMAVILVVTIAIVVGLGAAIEMGLRIIGFGKPLIYIADEQIGYLLAPNQSTRRFGNRIAINQYSMRGDPIEKTPLPSTLRVLLLGDSIANGGWWIDQAWTISSLMIRSLTPIVSQYFPKVEVLNASANSWGPRNELAYLQKFGNFHSQAVVLMINTDDLFAKAPTSMPVGRDRNYPDHQPAMALVEAFNRYLSKPKPIPEIDDEAGDRVGFNLEAISKIQALTHQANSQFLLVMTPLLREISEPGSRDYEMIARQRLSEFCQEQKISYIDFLPVFNSNSDPVSLYQDHIHLNLQGNQLVSQAIERSVLELLLLK